MLAERRVPKVGLAFETPAMFSWNQSGVTSTQTSYRRGRLPITTLIAQRLIDQFGPNQSVATLGPGDFEKLFARLSRRHAVSTLGSKITVMRSVFKYAYESGLIQQPVRFGPKFKTPSKQALRKHKAKSEQLNGKRLFTSDELRQIIDAAPMPLRAMVLLGINAALGNSDIANMPMSALDLKAGWLDYARGKTGIGRRCPLWPETVAALTEAIATRREPNDQPDAGIVFLTSFGQRWVRYAIVEEKTHGRKVVKAKFDDAIAKAFAKLLQSLGLKRPRIGFYVLRHTFETVAGGCATKLRLTPSWATLTAAWRPRTGMASTIAGCGPW